MTNFAGWLTILEIITIATIALCIVLSVEESKEIDSIQLYMALNELREIGDIKWQ